MSQYLDLSISEQISGCARLVFAGRNPLLFERSEQSIQDGLLNTRKVGCIAHSFSEQVQHRLTFVDEAADHIVRLRVTKCVFPCCECSVTRFVP